MKRYLKYVKPYWYAFILGPILMITEVDVYKRQEVPYYTATGWGGAATGGLLPVLGGYCDAPWDPRITEIEPSVNYVFTRERNDRNIGSEMCIRDRCISSGLA